MFDKRHVGQMGKMLDHLWIRCPRATANMPGQRETMLQDKEETKNLHLKKLSDQIRGVERLDALL